MRFTPFPTLLSLWLCAGIISGTSHNNARLQPRRGASMLINPPAQPNLPSIDAAKAAASAVHLNLDNIQGDILIGMRKRAELFFFFHISNTVQFKSKLKSVILPLVTSTADLLDVSSQPTTAVNIAFSQTGLNILNIHDSLNDIPFSGGQFNDASNLGDLTTNWNNIVATLASLKSKLGSSISEIYSLQGAARPGNQEGHEHFGYLDGISNPAVQGFQSPLPGQAVVPTGEILVGESGDNVTRPAWAKDGSFLVFRQLKQLVPEFNKFLTDNPIRAPGLTQQQGSDLLGARMIGRWKSGAPVFLAPTVDNPALGADPNRNNDFTYGLPGQTTGNLTDQTNCPFSAHIRKTRPRADLGLPEKNNHHIVRGGIPYGPEVTPLESFFHKTQFERGLAFVSYQSNIANGFQFLQQKWADNSKFIHAGVGLDPIIGAAQGAQRAVTGLDLTNLSRPITLTTDFVVSRGGEYFFSPSLSAISNTLSA
ncbi:DyP-type peroxidase [Mycena venus]|uniref:DyP-type peroxidase n=1 Tax=Mycena venus TaxID=2733690 RepID=A0A8H6XY52_9AGAR|nr:DyP-type peroxidase [Mycena venus]